MKPAVKPKRTVEQRAEEEGISGGTGAERSVGRRRGELEHSNRVVTVAFERDVNSEWARCEKKGSQLLEGQGKGLPVAFADL